MDYSKIEVTDVLIDNKPITIDFEEEEDSWYIKYLKCIMCFELIYKND